ncbi:ROK family transcriptional regulator [Paenibacillus yanchengensis]|uniref:ROK family transcriptional regulator n=1 Tax=Paenibacillus yanchengensis TaxID=2035833 RepID=A0ABW4YR13_9BACL
MDRSIMHALNKRNVISIIRESGQINKAEIARTIGLSIPTVMKITDELIDREIVRDSGKGLSSGGKPPQMLEFAADNYFIIGVDIGTTNINCIMMDLAARIIYQQVVPTGVTDGFTVIINRIIKVIDRVIASATAEQQQRILGIGLGMPGLIDPATGKVLFSPDFKWEMIDLLPPVQAAFRYPVLIDNVTRVMAIGQRYFGFSQHDVDSFICVNLGHGIGSALFLDGRLYSGSSGSSGELGHMTIVQDGPLCVCGKHGCLEALASGNAILNQAKQQFQMEHVTEAKDVFVAWEAGDERAKTIITTAAQHIGTALALMINLLDPQIIILEGGLSRAGETFLQLIIKTAEQQQMKYAGRATKIVVSTLAENSAAIGAATIILDRFIQFGGDKDSLTDVYGE